MKTWLSAGALLAIPFAVNAAGLGKLTVTSALGQQLRGEIDLVAVQKEDVGLLTVRLASQDAFKEAKIERPIAVSSVRFSVEKRPNGDPYVKVTSNSPINEPFLDLLIELNWPSGRVLREYTVLLDPPGFAESQAVAPVAPPQGAPLPAPVQPVAVPKETAPAPAAPTAPVAKKSVEKAAAKPAKAEEGAPAAAQAAETYGPVRRGETLAKIASQLKPEGVSLEQMLVGLYRDNPNAFANNMNRLKTGQILRVPEAGKLAELSQKEAAREVRVQAADWHAYRQKLAGAVAEAAPEKAQPAQAASGKITPKVEEKAAKPAPSSDVLKVSKGDAGKETKGLQDKIHAMEEEATARQKTIKEANERIAQLEKNVSEMQKLLDLKNKSLAELQKQAAPAPAPAKPPMPEAKPAEKMPEAKPVEKVEAAAPVKPEAAKPKEMPKPKDAAKPKETAKPKHVTPPPPPQPAWYEDILANPMAVGGGVAAVLLGGLGWLMAVGKRRRKNLTTFEDSIMTGGDLKANTVYGASAGGVIDTGDTSFLTDFSQAGLGNIDTHDVDPIAEAEVYMAYGRDAQAEEILKEAMNKDPNRHEIQLKLLEIYAGRKNTNAFEALASELYAAIGGQSSAVWDKAAEMGRQLDPSNPLYATGGGAAKPAGAESAAGMGRAAAGAAAIAEAEMEAPALPETIGEAAVEEAAAEGSSDLDFNLDTEPYTEPATIAPVMAEELGEDNALDFDLGLSLPAEEEAAAEPESVAEPETESIIPQVVEKQATVETESAPLDFEQAMAFEAAPGETPASEMTAAEMTATETEDIALEAVSAPEAMPDMAVPEAATAEVTKLVPQESPLDFDFQLEEEVAAAPAPAAAEAVPELDLAGISLDLGEPAEAATIAPVAAEGEADSQWQEVSTKLDLAKAYVEMGDKEGAREILQEVLQEGDDRQQEDAKALLAGIG